MKQRNNRDARTVPCGTSDVTAVKLLCWQSTTTCCTSYLKLKLKVATFIISFSKTKSKSMASYTVICQMVHGHTLYIHALKVVPNHLTL